MLSYSHGNDMFPAAAPPAVKKVILILHNSKNHPLYKYGKTSVLPYLYSDCRQRASPEFAHAGAKKIQSFSERHVRERKHFSRSERRIGRPRRTTEAHSAVHPLRRQTQSGFVDDLNSPNRSESSILQFQIVNAGDIHAAVALTAQAVGTA